MSREYSPFTPGAPVPLELFVGRQKEAEWIVESVKKSIHRESVVTLFVEGIRGIGKSSLCVYAMAGVEKQTKALVTFVPLGGAHTLHDFVKAVFDSIVRTRTSNKWYEPIRRIFSNHVENVDIFGVNVRFKAEAAVLEGLITGFPAALRSFLEQFPAENRPDGLVLVLDDINGLASQESFANWFKSLVETISRERVQHPLPVTFVFVGLPQRRHELIRQQQSLDRVFEVLPVEPLSQAEVEDFFVTAFESVGIRVEEDALRYLARIGRQGYPVFLHEIGDAVFNVDSDDIIDYRDAVEGVVRAIDVVGRKYVGPHVVEVLSSSRYRNILRGLRAYWEEYPEDVGRIIRANIMEIVSRMDKRGTSVLDNFLRKMIELNVIHRIEGDRSGVYAFDNILYAFYFGFMMGGDHGADIPHST